MTTLSTSTIRLLREIILKPDDDTVRLIFADAIEEDGDELWARYIRLSIAVRNEESKHLELDRCWKAFQKRPVCTTRDCTYYPRWRDEAGHHWGYWDRGMLTHLWCGNTQEFGMMAECLLWERGSGRDCPPTAHPVKKVSIARAGITSLGDRAMLHDLSTRFPGVEFDLRYTLGSVLETREGVVHENYS